MAECKLRLREERNVHGILYLSPGELLLEASD
jgi:hypothetical protein